MVDARCARQRWARCAAEHEAGSPWRPLLSAHALIALLTPDLGELELELSERAKWATEFALGAGIANFQLRPPNSRSGCATRRC